MNIITNLLQFQNQIKINHWQTYGFSDHKAYGELYDGLSESIDEFIEVFMGKYGRIMAKDLFSFNLQNFKSSNQINELDLFINYLTFELPKSLDTTKDTDLLNIRDEILGSVNKTKYLLTLK